ncbi:MAG: hypothetical protein NXI24_06840 [bacterium]|nr:hypothetical protein [bacterium]
MDMFAGRSVRVLFCFLFALSLGATGLQAQLVPQPNPAMRTLHTEHFQVHFPEGQGAMARRTARIAERIHAELEPEYDSGADNTHIVLVFSTDVVNAFATPQGIDQIVLFLDNPQQGTFSRYDLWAELLIRHEYVHILTLRHWGKKQPILTAFRVIFGIPPNFLSPFGLIEGAAVYQESKNGKGRLEDPLTDMFFRTAILENRFPTLAEIFNGSHRWPFGSLGYLYGGRFWKFVAENYGEEILWDYWKKDAAPFFVEDRLRPAPGLARIYKDFRAAETERFRTELAEIRAEGETPFSRLTTDGYNKSFLYIGEDGAVKYFARPRDSISGLYAIDGQEALEAAGAAASTAQPTAEASTTHPPDRPDEDPVDPYRVRRSDAVRGFAEAGGRKMYSEAMFFLPGTGLRYEMYDGEYSLFLSRQSPGRSISFPSLSSDGGRVYFITRDDKKRYLVAAQFDADDDLVGERVILETPFTGFVQYTALSPDDRSLVTLVRRGDVGEGELLLCDARTADVNDPSGAGACRVLVSGPGTKVQPRFTEDGASVIFASDADGIYNLYSVEVATGRITRMTRSLTGVFYPAPAADALYALGYFGEGYDVVRYQYADLLAEPVNLFAGPAVPSGDQDPNDPNADPATLESYFGEAGGDLAGDLPGGSGGPEEWEESDYIAPFAIRPYALGLFGPVSALNVIVAARDPLLRHFLVAAVGAASPTPIAFAAYDYSRYAVGLGMAYQTNYWKRKTTPGCINEEEPLRFLCDSSNVFFEEARGNVRYTGDYRFADTQILLGYSHLKLRNARRIRAVEYDARDLNLSGPTATWILGDVQRFPESISPELGWILFAQTDYYTKPESTDRPDQYERNEVEYGVAEGGLSLYLPSFWSHHVNYLNGFGYGSYGPDRELQKVRLNRFVRGQEYAKSPADHAAVVFTYEYRLPLLWWSEALFGARAGALTLDGVGMSVFYDYGTVFDRQVFREGWAGAYGLSFSFSFNFIYLNFPELKITFARGTGPAGEGQVYMSFNAEFGAGPAVHGHDSKPSPVLEPYNRGLMDRRAATGYFRDRWAGGVL